MTRLAVAAAAFGGSLLVGLAAAAGQGAAAGPARLATCGDSQPMRDVRGYREKLVVGDGPVLLIPIGGHGRPRISIAQSVRDRLGWRGQKTPWLVQKSYRGPVAVTAKRIDRAGQVRFALVYGQHLRKLTYPEDDRNPPVHGYYGLPSATLFRSTGCYAFRVTGRNFAERLVVRVVA
jgi:hypothetical protein